MLTLVIVLGSIFGYFGLGAVTGGFAITKSDRSDEGMNAILCLFFWPLFWACYLPYKGAHKFANYLYTREEQKKLPGAKVVR